MFINVSKMTANMTYKSVPITTVNKTYRCVCPQESFYGFIENKIREMRYAKMAVNTTAK